MTKCPERKQEELHCSHKYPNEREAFIDSELYSEATSRIKNNSAENTVPIEFLMKKFKISEEDLAGYDQVELE